MRVVRISLELGTFLAALASTLIAAVLVFSIGMVSHTVAIGKEIDAAFQQASQFIEDRIQSTGHLPAKSEFDEWRNDKNHWVSQIELTPSSQSSSEVKARFGGVPADAYVLAVWRGEWSEYYVQGKGSTIDSAAGLYASSIGIALACCGLAAALWLTASKLKRSNAALQSDA